MTCDDTGRNFAETIEPADTVKPADTITRDVPDVVGNDPAPWESGWTADTAGTENIIPPCEMEDSHACHWDADERGNGHGRSFVSDAHGNVTYLGD